MLSKAKKRLDKTYKRHVTLFLVPEQVLMAKKYVLHYVAVDLSI